MLFEKILFCFGVFIWVISDLLSICALLIADRYKFEEEPYIWKGLDPIQKGVLIAYLVVGGPFFIPFSLKIFLQSRPKGGNNGNT
jgi:hypothetical protein